MEVAFLFVFLIFSVHTTTIHHLIELNSTQYVRTLGLFMAILAGVRPFF